MATKLWRVEQQGTMGWEIVHPKAIKLNKEQAKKWLEFQINEGVNPKDLRAIPDIKYCLLYTSPSPRDS